MRRRTDSSTRVLPDGTPLRNRLLAALPAADYDRIANTCGSSRRSTGEALHEQGRRINDVYFPNGGVFSITNRMRDGELVEVATVGREGMLGIGVFLGDRSGTGRTFQQVADGPVAALAVAPFVRETAISGAVSRGDGVSTRRRRSCRRCSARPATRCTTSGTLLPLAAADARPRRRRRFPLEARVPGGHARRAAVPP